MHRSHKVCKKELTAIPTIKKRGRGEVHRIRERTRIRRHTLGQRRSDPDDVIIDGVHGEEFPFRRDPNGVRYHPKFVPVHDSLHEVPALKGQNIPISCKIKWGNDNNRRSSAPIKHNLKVIKRGEKIDPDLPF